MCQQAVWGIKSLTSCCQHVNWDRERCPGPAKSHGPYLRPAPGGGGVSSQGKSTAYAQPSASTAAAASPLRSTCHLASSHSCPCHPTAAPGQLLRCRWL